MLHRLFHRSVPLRDLPHFLMTRGVLLTYALLLSSAALLLGGENIWLASWYARYLQSMAALLWGVSLIGPLLLEDVLRKST